MHTELSEGIRKNEKMNHLEEKLSKMGYHFLIRKNGNEIYSNISPEEMEKRSLLPALPSNLRKP